MIEYRQDDRTIGWCPHCSTQCTNVQVDGRGYCELHGTVYVDWNPRPIGTRHRLVTETNGEQHVSSAIIPLEELSHALAWEEQIHAGAGWNTKRYPGLVRAERNGVVRWIWVRARNPMEDTL